MILEFNPSPTTSKAQRNPLVLPNSLYLLRLCLSQVAGPELSRPVEASRKLVAMSTQRIVPSAVQLGTIVERMTEYSEKLGHGPHSP
jgi:hypothetical protein